MNNDLVPTILVVIAPIAYLAYRWGAFGNATMRWLLPAFFIALVALEIPPAGLDFASRQNFAMLIAFAAVLVLLLRSLHVAWFMDARRWRLTLGAIAALALLNYVNFFSFHGQRSFIHYQDVAHYYLGSKYFAELGYGDLYVAMLRAEAEQRGGRLVSDRARDLSTNYLVDARELLAKSGPVKARFSAARWADFGSDVMVFRDADPMYASVLTDHGFNPTPVWALIGGTLANLVPAGSRRGILALTLLDPLLQAAALGAVVWAFGVESALLAAVYYCVIFGASFDWIGGAYLRDMWFAAVVGAACCVERERHRIAGALLGFAAALRLFPAFFAAGIVFKGAAELARNRRVRRPKAEFLVCFACTVVALVALSSLGLGGIDRWAGFFRNLRVHVESLGTNVIGLTNLIAYSIPIDMSRTDAVSMLFRRHQAVYRAQLVVILPATALLVAAVSPRISDVSALALGTLLVLAGLNLAGYYYGFLVLLLLANARRQDKLAVLFAVELATYFLRLFEEHDSVVYAYRSVLLILAVVAVYADEIGSAVLRSAGRRKAVLEPAP